VKGGDVISTIAQIGIRDHDLLQGLGDDDHVQYALRSILTTDGDIYIRSGGILTRLAIGAAGEFLKVSAGLPAWGGAASVKTGVTQVFSGTAPTAWTDLDLSPTIGAKYSLVFLSVTGSASLTKVVVRCNGDTIDYSGADTTTESGCAISILKASGANVLVVATDANGIIEWGGNAAATGTIRVIGYVN